MLIRLVVKRCECFGRHVHRIALQEPK